MGRPTGHIGTWQHPYWGQAVGLHGTGLESATKTWRQGLLLGLHLHVLFAVLAVLGMSHARCHNLRPHVPSPPWGSLAAAEWRARALSVGQRC
jgi:hypothetical protein